MSCLCNYGLSRTIPCITCLNVANSAATKSIIQKRIWNQVRTGSGIYTMNLSAFTSAASILASGKNVNWNRMSDQVLAATQPNLNATHGNSLHTTLTSDRPGAGTPGGSGVDVKHDSYARYLNRKKATNIKSKDVATVPLTGNKTGTVNLVANSVKCCN